MAQGPGQGWTRPGADPAVNDPHTGLSLPKAEWQVVEAQALVHTLDGWSVVDTVVVPTKTPDRKLVFGRGTLERLTGESSTRVPVTLPETEQAWPSLWASQELGSDGKSHHARVRIHTRPQHTGGTFESRAHTGPAPQPSPHPSPVPCGGDPACDPCPPWTATSPPQSHV